MEAGRVRRELEAALSQYESYSNQLTVKLKEIVAKLSSERNSFKTERDRLQQELGN